MTAMLLPRLGVWSMSRRRIRSRFVFRFAQFVARAFREVGLEGVSKKFDDWLESAKALWRDNLSDQLSALLASGKAECFIDLGAHVGEQSLLAAQYMPVYAFEPDPVAIEKLSRNIEDCKTKFPIEVIQKAATKFDGVANFYGSNRGRENTGSSSLNGRKRNVVGGDVYQVETCDIGRFIKDLPFEDILPEISEYVKELLQQERIGLLFDDVKREFKGLHFSFHLKKLQQEFEESHREVNLQPLKNKQLQLDQLPRKY